MHIDEFRQLQRGGATYNLFSLVMTCRRKFLNAARLLEVRSAAIDRLASLGVDTAVDCWPLLGPLTVLAERYVEQFFISTGRPVSASNGQAGRKVGQVFSSRSGPTPDRD